MKDYLSMSAFTLSKIWSQFVFVYRENLSHNLEKFDFWANSFEELPMYFMTFHGQEELEVVIDVSETYLCILIMML